MNNKIFNIISLCFLLTFASSLSAGDFDLRGQLSANGFGSYSSGKWNKYFDLRYMPQVTFTEYLTDTWTFDSEISLNTYFNTNFESNEQNVKLYRLKLRFATPQTETRIGLQKINFGPAYILRSLRWFDKLDPRDPLGLTDGVYALRFKYSFLNNSSFTFWTLYGNNDTKGYELFPTAKKHPEIGARYLFPFLDGETGLTVHTRIANLSSLEYRETKFAIDGRWDVEIGLWFEVVVQKNEIEILPYKWQSMTTLGTDYTFEIGNGLHVLAEHMRTTASDKFYSNDMEINLSALMFSYPQSLVDNFTGLLYYSWESEKLYKYIQWQRMYDNFSLSLSLFHYPEGELATLNNANIPNQGYGFQLTFIYNH